MNASPTLEHNAIEVWRVSLDVEPFCRPGLIQLLSAEERERADRFHFDVDRRRFIAARALLRVLLGKYLDRDPTRLKFTLGTWGKPSLEESAGAASLFFNLSHTGETALYAVTRIAPVGIDSERIQPDFAVEEIIPAFLAGEEAAALAKLPVGGRREAFYRMWTRKEAYCKARGQGLLQNLQGIDASLPKDTSSEWFSLRVEGVFEKGIYVRDLEIGADRAAAIAIESGPRPEIVHRSPNDIAIV